MSDATEDKTLIVRCIRMLEHMGIMDFNGHASIRQNENRMLINIGSCQRSRLTADDICLIDFDGDIIEGNGKPPLEFHLHAGIYKERPDVQAVIHCHPNWSTILTTAGHGYLPVYAQGTLAYPMPILDSPNSINNPEMAKALTDVLGDRPAALMKAHGAVTAGKSLVDAFVLLNYLEDNSERQYMAQQVGTPYSFSDEEIAMCHEKLWNDGLFKRTWDHYSAKLDAASA
jgi:L-fuculose-phosphate aldolase